jgi:hypothetical protein
MDVNFSGEIGGNENCKKSLTSKSKEKRALKRTRSVWENNIKVDLNEKVCKI